jgi:hypothetical protein
MSPVVDPNLRTRSLTADDRAGACYLYPASVYHCDEACDCPAVVGRNNYGEYNEGRLECADTVCGRLLPMSQSNKPLGAACTGNDCASGLFCQPVGGAGAYCSRICNPAASDCPSGFDCWPYEGSSQGACLPRNMSGPAAETCLADEDELSGDPGDPEDPAPDPGTLPSRPRSTSYCACDATWDCDPDCSCDPDPCQGCAAVPGVFWIFSVALLATRRSRV